MQHCTSGWETGAPRSGHGFLPGQKENEHAQWSCLLYWSGHALETSGMETSIFVSFVFKVSFLEMDPTHLKCAVNFFFFSAKDGTQGLTDSLCACSTCGSRICPIHLCMHSGQMTATEKPPLTSLDPRTSPSWALPSFELCFFLALGVLFSSGSTFLHFPFRKGSLLAFLCPRIKAMLSIA